MLVFWKARLVLLALPKTGTTALEAALLPHADAAILNPPGQKHCTVRKYHAQLAKFFEQNGTRKMDLVAVMREPVGWLSSWHRYRARAAIAGSAVSTAGIGFDAFVTAWLAPEPPDYARVGRQRRFLSDARGRLGVQHLFRHDRLEEAVAFLEDRVGTALALDRHNVSPGTPEGLAPETEARLRAGAAEEFALWEDLCAGRLALPPR